MNAVRLIAGVALLACLGSFAMADGPLIDCVGSACGGGGPTAYAYLVDSVSYPMMEFRVGTNDLDPAHYTNVLIPPGWQFAVEEVWMAHLHGVHTPHGEVSPGPCWCLTAGSARWWTDDPALAVEYFTFGYDHSWLSEDVGWELITRREGPPPEYYTFHEFWDNPVGCGAGPVHGPWASSCWSDDDCGPWDYCRFQPCAVETGVCVPKPAACAYLWDPVCGCDGVTYPSDCVAAMHSMSVDYWGECDDALCFTNDDCAYADEAYCRKEMGDCTGPGTCTMPPPNCPEFWDPVCGCDGATYENECLAAMAGVSIAHDGACESCWSYDQCSPEEYCFFYECSADAGACLPQPGDCPEYAQPVCGCDHVTYDNPCFAAASGASLAYQGSCLTGDFDLDGDVGLYDFAFFEACMSGPDEGVALPCAVADLDQDIDVDLADFRIFQNSFQAGSGPRMGDVTDSGCLEPPGEGPCPEDDEIQLTVQENTLHILHANATYNCCPDDIVISLTVEGNVLHLIEEEILTDPCWCICCYEVEGTVVDLAPGEYTVEFCWYDYDTGQVRCHVQDIVIPPGPRVGSYVDSGCLEPPGSGSCPEDDEISLTVDGNTLHVLHANATYNCCLDEIVISLSVEGTLLRLTEEEIVPDPCYCICCYNVEATVVDLVPGEYTVEFYWYDYETDQEQCYVEIIVVPSGSASMGSVAHTGCLDPPGEEEPCVEDDEIELTVEGNTLHVAHWNATYNCCLDDIAISLTVEGNLLRLTEDEILTAPCDCMCCYNAEATVVDLAPGEYTAEFCWDDWETGGELCYVQEVVIP